MKASLEDLYTSFNHPESARDPIQVVRRYERLADREVIGFLAAALAFGRVASVIASIEAASRILGPAPAQAVRTFDPRRDGGACRTFVHRWITGRDLAALFWLMRQLLTAHGSLERAFAAHLDSSPADVQPALEGIGAEVRRMDLARAYGRSPRRPGVWYFFPRPSAGSACKRLNLFLRWMVRRDAIDPGGWTAITPRQLIVPLDTHTIRVGRCLGLTRRVSPGWKMATDITTALRAFDADDPVRYDFALCHLSMKGACGWQNGAGNARCPLRGFCRPAGSRA
jgi:uncharacterized protein (TIGR02757 family)